jgi:hypothetical protein
VPVRGRQTQHGGIARFSCSITVQPRREGRRAVCGSHGHWEVAIRLTRFLDDITCANSREASSAARRWTCSDTIVGCRRFVHVSLFRDRDRTLLSGDALITVKQESAIAVATQRRSMHGPPAYFTQDWPAAERSVRRLAALEPETLLPGHGEAWSGPGMRSQLRGLVTVRKSRRCPHSAATPGSQR